MLVSKVGLKCESDDGWVRVSDILGSDYFKDMTKDILMKANLDSILLLCFEVVGDCGLQCSKASCGPMGEHSGSLFISDLGYQLSPDLVYIRAYNKDEKKVAESVFGDLGLHISRVSHHIFCVSSMTSRFLSQDVLRWEAFKEGGAAPAAAGPSEKKGAGAASGSLRGDAPEFVPSSNPLLAPMQNPGLEGFGASRLRLATTVEVSRPGRCFPTLKRPR